MAHSQSRNRHYVGAEPRSEAGVASAARTASGTGAAFDTEDAVSLEATLAITAASGTTPTLDVRLETTVDGTNWDTVASFAQQTGVQAGRGRAFGPVGRQCRWAWTIAGTTPSFTFSVSASARRGR